MNIFDEIGFYGPYILGFSSLLILRNRPTWLFAYILGYGTNIIIILTLKLLIRQPRPNQDLNKFYALENKGITQFNAYGMPSGHAQSTVFSTFYIWLATKNFFITFLYAVVSLLSIHQRIKYKFHCLLQIIVGGILGLVVAYITCIYVRRLIPGKLREKPDDNGPI